MFSSANVFIYSFVGRQFKDTLKIILTDWTPKKGKYHFKTDEAPSLENENTRAVEIEAVIIGV